MWGDADSPGSPLLLAAAVLGDVVAAQPPPSHGCRHPFQIDVGVDNARRCRNDLRPGTGVPPRTTRLEIFVDDVEDDTVGSFGTSFSAWALRSTGFKLSCGELGELLLGLPRSE